MNVPKTMRRVGVRKLSLPAAKPVKLIKVPPVPKVKAYGAFPKGHVY